MYDRRMAIATKKIPRVITVDGTAGSGKGTISLKLAEELGWHFLDSGALYRVLAYLYIVPHIQECPVDLIDLEKITLKEDVLENLGTIITETTDSEILKKLNDTKQEIDLIPLTKYSYYRLKQLKNGLN